MEQVAREVSPIVSIVPQDAWPVIYSAGFAGIVCLILLWILFKVLSKHTEAQIRNTMQLEEISRDLKEISTAFRAFQSVIERRK
jgi:hypothetical protein